MAVPARPKKPRILLPSSKVRAKEEPVLLPTLMDAPLLVSRVSNITIACR
ncbi:unnamed protein product [Musa acuminata subsp. burmannicoides]